MSRQGRRNWMRGSQGLAEIRRGRPSLRKEKYSCRRRLQRRRAHRGQRRRFESDAWRVGRGGGERSGRLQSCHRSCCRRRGNEDGGLSSEGLAEAEAWDCRSQQGIGRLLAAGHADTFVKVTSSDDCHLMNNEISISNHDFLTRRSRTKAARLCQKNWPNPFLIFCVLAKVARVSAIFCALCHWVSINFHYCST
jgi:hypothetical protein